MFYEESFKTPFLLLVWIKFSPHCHLYNRNVHFHCAKSKPPNNSNGSTIFILRFKNTYFCPTLKFYLNTVYPAQGCKVFSLFSKLLGTGTSLASLGALGFQLLQKLDQGGIRSVCFNGFLCACCFSHRARTSFNVQISASLKIPVVLRSSTAADWCLLAAKQSHLLILMEQAGCPCSK